MNEIEEFINRRFGDTDANWLNGNCYYMSLILSYRFPYLRIYYLPITGHFVAGADGKFYDARGCIEINEPAILFDDIQHQDPLLYKYLIRDCIN